MLEQIYEKLGKPERYYNKRRIPIMTNKFKIGDIVRTQEGPAHKLIKQIGDYAFLTNDNYSVNCRKLKFIRIQVDEDENEEIKLEPSLNTEPMKSLRNI